MTLYTLTGLPYSGKTTLRKKLMNRFDFKLISIDEIMNENDMWRKGHPTIDDWNKAYTIAYDNLKRYLEQGHDVLFDGASLKKSERETQRKIAESLRAKHKLIWVNTPFEVIFDRKLKNEAAKERGQLSTEEMKTASEMFDEPSKDENPILYNQDMDLATWIKNNFS